MTDPDLVSEQGVDETENPAGKEPLGPGGDLPDDPDVAPPVPMGSEPLGPGQEVQEGEG